ncbi:hypothetical protein V6Z12_A05G114600 [Gossypium hirsutum]
MLSSSPNTPLNHKIKGPVVNIVLFFRGIMVGNPFFLPFLEFFCRFRFTWTTIAGFFPSSKEIVLAYPKFDALVYSRIIVEYYCAAFLYAMIDDRYKLLISPCFAVQQF